MLLPPANPPSWSWTWASTGYASSQNPNSESYFMSTVSSPPAPILKGAVNSETIDARTQAIKKTALALLLALIVAISWLGLIDTQSVSFIDESLKQALIAYGVARGLNAVVSVLQTFHVLGLGVGEVLDPINDLVERFSSVMELAIGSLFIQKILLEITSSLFFKVALTASGGLWILSLYVRTGINALLLSRVFITMVFIRFSISLVVVLNGMVAAAFVTEKIDLDVAVVSQIKKSAPGLEVPSLEEAGQPGAAPDVSAQSGAAQAAPDLQTPPLEKKGWFSSVGGKLGDMGTKLNDVSAKFFAVFKEMAKKWDQKAIKEKLDKVIPQMLNLMALFLLKTLILPLVFLFGLKYILEQVWNVKPYPFYTGKPQLA